MTNYYQKLKFKNDILGVALSLGFNGKSAGTAYQGDCPKHSSNSGRCLTIWPIIQGWKCFHCNARGDVIDLVMHFKNCDHITAVNFLADLAKMPRLGKGKLTADEIAKLKSEQEKKTLVYSMLTAAADWYHHQLENFPTVYQHLTEHYKFSDQIIRDLSIGVAPPGSSMEDSSSDLAAHLIKIPEFKNSLPLTGLFSFKHPKGPYYDYFKGRIIIPFWKDGKVVDLIARAVVNLTLVDQYECYNVDPDGAIKCQQ